MTSKIKVKEIKDKIDEKTEFLGYISDLGNGIVLDPSLQIVTDSNNVPIEVNLMNSEQYDLLDTHGLSNIGNYLSKEDHVKKGEMEYENALTGKTERVNLRKTYAIQETEEGLLIKSTDKKNPISKSEFIDGAITSKPRTLRSPRFLILDQDTTSKDAEDIIQKTYEEIKMNNIDKYRADTLNIVTVPKEQWEKLALKSEIEKEIFGKYGFPNQTYDLSVQAKLLRDYKLGLITKTQFNNQFELPKKLTIIHPFDKEYVKKKLIPKQVEITKLEYDILTDPDPQIENDPNIIGIYGLDTHKIVIKNGVASVLSQKPNNEPIDIDLTTPSTFTDPNVLTNILQFQPDFYSNQYPSNPKDLNYGTQKTQGLTSTRVGLSNSNMPLPLPSDNLEKIMNESKDLQRWKQAKPEQYNEYIKLLTQFENNNKNVNPIQCVQGAVPIIRKASLDAWGTTPKQFKCTKDIAENRIEQINSKIKSMKVAFNRQNKIISQLTENELKILAIDELDKDPNFKSIVGCNSDDELIQLDSMGSDNDEESTKEPFILVPMRFPTERAMGDTIYCRSISNISPYSIKVKEKTEDEMLKLTKGLEELAFDDNLSPQEITDIKSRSKYDIQFKRNTNRKKSVLLLQESTKKK